MAEMLHRRDLESDTETGQDAPGYMVDNLPAIKSEDDQPDSTAEISQWSAPPSSSTAPSAEVKFSMPVASSSSTASSSTGGVGYQRNTHYGQQYSNNNTANGRSRRPEESLTGAEYQLRILMDSSIVGVIIGRNGLNIKEIRDQSGARINISSKTPDPERIMTIIGTIDVVAKATALACRKINESALKTAPGAQDVENTAVTLRLLVPNHMMGGVIGKGGSSIRKIQEESNARVSASEEPLPGSTERVVTVIGVPDAIHIATFHICERLLEQPPNSDNRRAPMHTPYTPGTPQYYPRMGYAAAGMHTGGAMAHDYRNMHGGMVGGGHHGYAYGGMATGMAAAGMHMGAMGMGGYTSHNPHMVGDAQQASVTRQLMVPDRLIGGMIGKGGTRINHIRNATGCKVTIGDAPAGPTGDRPIAVSGPPQACDMAMRLLNERLAIELARPADGGVGGGDGGLKRERDDRY
ncbi:PAB1 binding protein [Sorochytrium milnesiophthora]